MPAHAAFFKAVLDCQEHLRLYSTVQAQVEGHLALSLGPDRGITISRQTTRSITETILESAELAQVSLPGPHHFFSLTKTINYDRATKSLHFFFFPGRQLNVSSMCASRIAAEYTPCRTPTARNEGPFGDASKAPQA